ncbi:DUF6221 family protein [Streptomyces sp. CC208A]|uniref:DUF6221 family protein n=1 Tax=Streptomyces sp. CC208A TaxID=3044573 RepID=UPI0024A8E2CA|nr:DUF6221 family protein [Streptomyces sp. CC208A]
MDDLVQFLRARLDEDEQTARAAGGEPWTDEEGFVDADPWFELPNELAAHALRHDPARVLAEVDAKRKLLDRYDRAFENRRAHPDDLASAGALLALHGAVELLALPYVDHPDYCDKWRP